MNLKKENKGRMVYFGVNEVWILDKFSPAEISLFFKEGVKLFAKLKHTQKSKQFLEDNEKIAGLIQRW